MESEPSLSSPLVQASERLTDPIPASTDELIKCPLVNHLAFRDPPRAPAGCSRSLPNLRQSIGTIVRHLWNCRLIPPELRYCLKTGHYPPPSGPSSRINFFLCSGA